MKKFFRQNGILLLVIALLLSILIGLTSALMGGNADPLSNVVNTVTAPVRGGIAAVLDWAEGVYAYVFRYGEIQDELDSLRAQVAALEEQVLDARLVRELAEGANRNMDHVLGALAPRLLVPVLLERAGIPGDKKARDVTREERRRLLELFKAFSVSVTGPRPIAEAIVTAGGIKVGEIDPKTMASKKVSGLFFAGEMIDVDAYTGGFNLQIAWATGRAAGESAAAFCAAQR